MSFDEITHESIADYEDHAAREAAKELANIKCWCGGATAASDVGPLKLVCLESVWHDPTNSGSKTETKTLYVAGPMTGYPEANYPAFNQAAYQLRAVGFAVVNPAEFGSEQPTSYAELLKRDLHAMMECDGVATLESWWESVGARNEVQVAGLLQMPVRSIGEWIQIKTGR